MARSALGSLPQFVVASATQGSADAFVTTRIETGISTAARYAWMIDRVEFFLALGSIDAWANADSSFEAQITQGSAPAAIVAATSTDFICCRRLYKAADGTPASAQFVAPDLTWSAPENLVVVDPSLNLNVDSTATAVANVVVARIWYWPVELSEMDILRMLALR